VPVIEAALIKAKIQKKQLSAIAYTRSRLMGSLVGFFAVDVLVFRHSFDRVNHMHAHTIYMEEGFESPTFHFFSF
jgi:N6-L-threonylcarbamoyladenine synthase